MYSTLYLTKELFNFLKIVIGLVHKPYQTYRKLSFDRHYSHLIYLTLAILVYLLLSTLAKQGLRHNPLFLTKSALEAGIAVAVSFFLFSFIIYLLGKLFGGVGRAKDTAFLWAFTLIPTLAWFLVTTIFYVLIPPPRTYSLQGQIFSLVFLAFSIACFFWKGILYYLALRVGLKLNAIKIAFVSIFALPISFLYALLLNKLGIFGVPFI